MSDQLPSMMSTRRSFLATTTATASAAILAPTRWIGSAAAAPLLTVASRTIEVNGKAAKVFQVKGTGVGHGIVAEEGTRFSGALLNATDIPLQLHWHGQIKAPYDQDRARPNGGALAPGQTDSHDFALTPGTHWMHAHTLEEQQLLAAPMVALEKNRGDVQDVVVMLHDFAFRSPKEILAELGGVDAHAGHGSNGAGGSVATGQQPARGSGSGSGSGHMMGAAHANDVRYDAYLANDRTLDDPEVVKVDKGTRVRLRIINGSTATAYFVSTPGLRSQCVAVDGSSCQPVQSESYPLAQGQRIDLLVTIPPAGGAFPVLAQVEAERFLTGIVLATPGAEIAKQGKSAKTAKPMVGLGFEMRLQASTPLAKRSADKQYRVILGEEPGYRWTLNGAIYGEHRPLDARTGERVEITFMNPTGMMHPMHLHGHHFQVVGIGGRSLSGPVRDTVIVPAHAPVTIAFDAGEAGSWFMHCHHLYHMATGMMTEVRIV